MAEGKQHVGLVIVGHVDAGKSTTTGRLLFELGGIDERQMAKLEEEAAAEGKSSFKFAFFMDKSKEERSRGVTIACTTKEFFTDKYHYTIIDAPGHRDFIKNMISGASQADVALLMVPANKGGFETAIAKGEEKGEIKGQTRHHAELCNLIGITQIMVGVNKMDEKSCNYSEARFKEIEENMRAMLKKTGWKFVQHIPVIPISGWAGDNVTEPTKNMPWYKGWTAKYQTGVDDKKKPIWVDVKGMTLKEALNSYVCPPARTKGKPFRMPVSGVYKIKGTGDVITGRIEQGEINPETKIHFLPSGVSGKVFSIEMHHKQVQEATHGDNVGLNIKGLQKGNMPKVGDVMAKEGDETIFRVATFTAEVKVQDHKGKLKPGGEGKDAGGYTPLVLIRTTKSACRMKAINWVVPRKALKKCKSAKDIENAKVNPGFVERGDFASIVFEPQQPMCCQTFADCPGLGRIAVLESNGLVMLGKIKEVTKYVKK